jgi:hypothetical protein
MGTCGASTARQRRSKSRSDGPTMKAQGERRKSARTREHLTAWVHVPHVVGDYKMTATAFMPGPLPWTRKLRQKLDRLEFPELTAGREKLTEGKWLARRLTARLRKMNSSEVNDFRAEYDEVMVTRRKPTAREINLMERAGFGSFLSNRLMDAALKGNRKFFEDFAAGLQLMPEKRDSTADLYEWLLENSERVEACHTVAEIVRLLPPGLEVSQKSFERICREVGLPLARRVTTGTPPKRRQPAVKLPPSSHAKHGSGNRRREKARR